MISAIAGDMIGSVYERNPIKHQAFPLFHRRLYRAGLPSRPAPDRQWIHCLC